MMSRIFLFVGFSIFFFAAQPVTENTGVALMRFSSERVSRAKNHYIRRMRRAKGVLTGVVFGVPTAIVGGWWGIRKGMRLWNARAKATEISTAEDSFKQAKVAYLAAKKKFQKSVEDSSEQNENNDEQDKALALWSTAVCAAEKSVDSARAELERLKNPGQQSGSFTAAPQSPASFFGQTLKFGLALGVAGLIITAGHQVFRVASGTLDEMIQLWLHGYRYWYRALEEQTRGIMNELHEVLYQARRTTQQSPTEQQLLVARQQRRGHLATEMNSHYRLDIITLYQRLVGSFERLVGLMLIIASPEQQMAVHQQVSIIAERLDAVAQSLECDLNDTIQGVATHYSNATLDRYYEAVEAITVYFTTFRMYLKK